MREIFALATLTTLLLQGVPAGAQSAAPVFAPTNGSEGVAIPDDYVIGPEDVLGVLFWREPDLSGDVTVRPDGKITLPLIGEIVATGLTPVALRDQLQKAGSRFLADPNVTVVVRQINSRKVFITGEVMMPGAFPLASPRNVLQLIALAGGLTEFAAGHKISVLRTDGGRTVTLKFNYNDVSKGRNLEQNVQLRPDDTVVVP